MPRYWWNKWENMIPGTHMSPLDQMYRSPAFVEAHSTLEGKLKIPVDCMHLLHVRQMLLNYLRGPCRPASLRHTHVSGQPRDDNSNAWMVAVSVCKRGLKGIHASHRSTGVQRRSLEAGGACLGRLGNISGSVWLEVQVGSFRIWG